MLVSQGLDRKLSWNERLSVRLHLFACKVCPRFKRQVEFLRSAIRRGAEQLDAASTLQLSAPARERIRKALQRTRL